YIKQRQYSNASLADFLSDIEAGSGRDLKAWSKLWLETAGLNTLRPLPTSKSETLGSLTIKQEAPPEFPTIRPHRLAVGLYDRKSGALQLRRRVELDVAGEDTPVKDFDGERLADLLLVNDLDLTYAKIRLDERSLSTATEHPPAATSSWPGRTPSSAPRARRNIYPLCAACWTASRSSLASRSIPTSVGRS